MSVKPLILACALLASAPLSAQLLLNEIETGAADAFEIWNPTASAISLDGWAVSYGAIDPTLVWITRTFAFPPVSIPAGGFAVVRENPATSAAPGAVIIDDPANIPWPTAGPGARGGSAVLLDPTGAGVDAVVWNDPPGLNNLAGSVFTGSLLPAGSTLGRLTQVDTDDAQDWGEPAPSFGALNPPQIPQPRLELSATTTGVGDLEWSLVSLDPPLPGAEIYNFFSLEDSDPDGSGPFFGVGFDAIPLLLFPAAPPPAGLFHTFLDGSGVWSASLPAGVVPAGWHIEFVSIAIVGPNVERISEVVSVDF